MDSKRLACIDTLRFLAIWAIIIIHAHYYFSWADKDITGSFNIPSWLLDKACSFAVPLFYIISGYFLGKSFLKEKNITKICLRHIQRLLIVFIAWSFIYSLDSFQPFSTYQWPIINQHGWIHAYYWHLQDNYFKNPVILLMIGGAGHLWFISALIQSIILILLFVSLNKEKFLIYFALLAYALTPLAIHYLHPLPGYDYDWNPMIGLFNSIPPVVLGWWFSKKKESRQSTAFLILITGIALSCGEFAN